MAERPDVSFDELLARHRKAAGLTQEELAVAAGVSTRTVSDLERGLTTRPHKHTTRRLASALNLTGHPRDDFEAAARRLSLVTGHSAAGDWSATGNARPADGPQDWLAFIVAEMDEAGVDAARSAIARWQRHMSPDPAWLTWVDRLITLTAEGRLQPASRRPLPAAGRGRFLDREQQTKELRDFLDHVQRGRGGLALVLGPAGIGKSRLVLDVVEGLPGVQVEWLTFDRGEAGYQGWRRLLAPLWTTLRRTELAPASLVPHAATLDDLLIGDAAGEPAGGLLPGEAADAVAALVSHLAARRPLVLVIDDAHRGGASSDHLLLEVARRVSAHSVGLVAAIRPDELEDDSPLLGYGDEAGGRSAMDMVAPIHVPPLDGAATARLIQERTGIQPPPMIVEQVLRATGGRPQLVNSAVIQAPPGGAPSGSWVVGKLDAEGLRVLDSTIASRSEAERTILQAAALCATDGCIQPDIIAIVADLPADFAERVLDRELQHGSMLTTQNSGYCFQHDNWIDALVSFCPPAKLRAMHARCLTLLRADPASDPRRLAHHAIGAGAALVGAREFVTLITRAADLALCDYAFSSADELYATAARYTTGEELIGILIKQSDARRFRGLWDDARNALKRAASLARTLGMPSREALALIHLERLTWSYGLEEQDLTRQIRAVLEQLPPGETALRAQAQAALAMRLSITPREHENEQADLANAALDRLPSVTEPIARADIILGIRHGLQDTEPPEKLLDFDQQLLDLAIDLRSAYHIHEALAARIVDIIRSGRLLELSSAVRAYRDFADQSGTPVVVYTQALIDAMLALARGDFGAVGQHIADASRLSEEWGQSMAREALMAQVGWLLYETGQTDGLTEILAELPQQNVSSLNEPVWSLAAAIIYAETGEAGQAIRILREICMNTQDLQNLPRGPGRIGILAASAIVLGHPIVGSQLATADASRWASSIASLLTAHPDELVVAGWPAVLLGSKHRFIGLAHLAAGQTSKAAAHLARAADGNAEFPALDTRTRFDLARALIRQPASHSEGITDMKRVEQKAARLGMACLTSQAATELKRHQRPQR